MLSFTISNSQQKIQIVVQTIKDRWNVLSPLQKKVIGIVLAIFAGVIWFTSIYKLHKIVRRLDHSKVKEGVKYANPAKFQIATNQIKIPNEKKPFPEDGAVLEVHLGKGKGKITFHTGLIKEGVFQADKLIKEKRKMTWTNGIYEGEVSENKPHGQGQLITVMNSCMNGEFVEGQFVRGTYLYKEDIYEGQFSAGKLTGTGKKTLKNGDVYEGHFIEDKLNGKGKITFHTGVIEEGVFQADKLIKGKLKMAWEYGIYEGEVSENRPHGQGKLIRASSRREGEFVEGEFVRGTYFYGKEIYEGQFSTNLLTGVGKKTLENGDVYEGSFKRDKLNGKGQITYAADGRKVTGTFVEDVLILMDV